MVWSVVSQVNVKEPIVHTCQPATVVDVKFRVPLWLSYQESMPDDQKFPGKTHVLSENKFHWRLSAYIFIWTKLHCWIYNYTTLVLLFLQGFSIKYIHACTNSQLYGWNWFYKVSRVSSTIWSYRLDIELPVYTRRETMTIKLRMFILF